MMIKIEKSKFGMSRTLGKQLAVAFLRVNVRVKPGHPLDTNQHSKKLFLVYPLVTTDIAIGNGVI